MTEREFIPAAYDPDTVATVAERLTQPIEFDRIQPPGRGNVPAHVKYPDLITLFIERTGGAWDAEILELWQADRQLKQWNENERKQEIVTTPVAFAKVKITVPGLGSRTHIGLQALRDGSGEDLEKGAISDGYKKCIEMFGLAAHVEADFEAGRRNAGSSRPQEATGAREPRQMAPDTNRAPRERDGGNARSEAGTTTAAPNGQITEQQIEAVKKIGRNIGLEDSRIAASVIEANDGLKLSQLSAADGAAEIKRWTAIAEIVRLVKNEPAEISAIQAKLGTTLYDLPISDLAQIKESVAKHMKEHGDLASW